MARALVTEMPGCTLWIDYNANNRRANEIRGAREQLAKERATGWLQVSQITGRPRARAARRGWRGPGPCNQDQDFEGEPADDPRRVLDRSLRAHEERGLPVRVALRDHVLAARESDRFAPCAVSR